MAIERLVCPECETVLRPAKPVAENKKVICPNCKTTFLAKPSPAEAGPAKAKSVPAKPKAEAKPAPKPEPKKPDPNADDEEGGTYGVIRDPDEEEHVEVKGKGKKKGEPKKKKPEVNYAPDESIKDLRGPAQAEVIKPSNFLLITGLIGFLGWLVALVLMLIPFLFPLDNADAVDKTNPKEVQGFTQGLAVMSLEVQPPPPDAASELKAKEEAKKTQSFLVVFGYDLAWLTYFQWYMFVLCLVPLFIGLIYSGMICAGASMIQNLDSRAWGIAASIMVMFPLNAGGFLMVCLIIQGQLLGMIFDDDYILYIEFGWIGIVCVAELAVGIYMLVVLLKEKVRDGFNFKPE